MGSPERQLRRYQGPAGIVRRGPAVILSPREPTGPPPSAPGGGSRLFDPSPHRNRGMVPAPDIEPRLLNQVIAECVAFGMPPAEANEGRTNPYVRTHLIMLWGLIVDAREGDGRAKAALDRIRFAFNHRADVAEIIGAHEQPADSGELTELLGGDAT